MREPTMQERMPAASAPTEDPTHPRAAARASVATRWLGVGLAAALAVVTLGLDATGRLALYLNPDSAWFAVAMAIVVLVGAVLSFLLPLGAEDDDHGHDHADHAHAGSRRTGAALRATGGVAASVLVLLALATPPASLSAELAMTRDTGAPPLFAGSDAVALAATGDTSSFGVGEWATVFASATNPEAYDGDRVSLSGFVTPGDDGFALTRLVITHCVIDAQPASVPVSVATAPATGQWVTVTGTVRAGSDGRLTLAADTVEPIDEPQDPYEY